MDKLFIVPAVLLAVYSVSAATHAQPEPRPNIVWIVADDMSPDMGCYGDGYAWTPNLDRLAAEGARYTHAFAVNGQCAPSRSALITGMYPTSIGTHNMRCQAVPPADVQFASVYLRAAGYFCVNNGKADYNLGVGNDERSGIFVSPRGAWDAEGASADWEDRDPGQPFFAVFNLAQTHESRLHFDEEPFETLVADVPRERRHDPAAARLPEYYPDNSVFRSDWARYYDMVSAMDLEAGRILDRLDAEGLRENTVVFFFGDHGRPLPRAKRWLYDSGLRVPLIVRWPGVVPESTVVDELVSFVDFAPTVLAIADVSIPPHMQGQIFLGEHVPASRPYVFGQRDRVDEIEDRVRSVRGTRYHYIRNFRPELPYSVPSDYMDRMPSMREWRRLNETGILTGAPGQFFQMERPAEEFYDTAADPDEVQNLVGDPEHSAQIDRFRRALDDWIMETGDLGQYPERELKERWRPNGTWAKTLPAVASPAPGRVELETGIVLTCGTEGAVIEYTMDAGRSARWRIYASPIFVSGDMRLRARTSRLGFRNGDEIALEYFVK